MSHDWCGILFCINKIIATERTYCWINVADVTNILLMLVLICSPVLIKTSCGQQISPFVSTGFLTIDSWIINSEGSW